MSNNNNLQREKAWARRDSNPHAHGVEGVPESTPLEGNDEGATRRVAVEINGSEARCSSEAPLESVAHHLRPPPIALDVERRFWSYVQKRGSDECWPWVGTRYRLGYGTLKVNGHMVTASRLSLELALGRQLRSGEYALHRCDNPPCVNPAHLFLGTKADNMADMMRKERSTKVLTGEKVRAVLAAIASGETFTNVAMAFGISKKTVSTLAYGRSWRHIPREPGLAETARRNAEAASRRGVAKPSSLAGPRAALRGTTP